MRTLLIHNRYQQAGGEDSVVRAESALLLSRGHEVEIFEEDNDSIVSWIESAKTAVGCIYSTGAASRIRGVIRRHRPDVVHVHNFFPRLSPAVHYACHGAGLPVVQTLHNYRIVCPGATLFRDGRPCEECLGRLLPIPAVEHGCYRGSRAASAAVAGMIAAHRALKTWHRRVDRFITLSEFARRRFIAAGLPADRIVVKPNFVSPDPGPGSGDGDYALFVGRLTPEKGLDTLIEAWKMAQPGWHLKIVGDGPLSERVRAAARPHQPCANRAGGVEWLGRREREEVLGLMAHARVLIMPSLWYEGGVPLVMIEGFSVGLPSIASRLGAMTELEGEGGAARLFEPGSSRDLADQIRWAFHNPGELTGMRCRARSEFERSYSAEANYARLMEIYRSAGMVSRPGIRPGENP